MPETASSAAAPPVMGPSPEHHSDARPVLDALLRGALPYLLRLVAGFGTDEESLLLLR